jgi:hypothetical protein
MNSFVTRQREGKKLTTERLFVLRGFEDSLGRPIHGIFEICIAPELIRQQMQRASKNKSKQSWDGPVMVFYKAATRDEAERLIDYLQREANAANALLRRAEETLRNVEQYGQWYFGTLPEEIRAYLQRAGTPDQREADETPKAD